jgi:hypothetical protein
VNGRELERFRELCADEPSPRVTCYCGATRRPAAARRYAGEAAKLDPFCSRVCAERWHARVRELRAELVELERRAAWVDARPYPVAGVVEYLAARRREVAAELERLRTGATTAPGAA